MSNLLGHPNLNIDIPMEGKDACLLSPKHAGSHDEKGRPMLPQTPSKSKNVQFDRETILEFKLSEADIRMYN